MLLSYKRLLNEQILCEYTVHIGLDNHKGQSMSQLNMIFFIPGFFRNLSVDLGLPGFRRGGDSDV